jgi:hypothetical protein
VKSIFASKTFWLNCVAIDHLDPVVAGRAQRCSGAVPSLRDGDPGGAKHHQPVLHEG